MTGGRFRRRQRRELMASRESREGFPPATWGPAYWHILYMQAVNYNPERQREAMRRAILDLRVLLPCSSCRRSVSRKLTQLGFMNKAKQDQVLASRDSLFQFIHRLHIAANAPRTVARSSEVRANYERLRANYTPRLRAVLRIEPDMPGIQQPGFEWAVY